MQIVKFESQPKPQTEELLRLLEEMKAMVVEQQLEQGIVILFDKTGAMGTYGLACRHPIAAIGWLELTKRAVTDLLSEAE